VRKPDFTYDVDGGSAAGVPFAAADGQRGPLAHAIGGQNGRATSWRGEKRGGSVRLVMLSKQDLASRHSQVRRDDSAHPDLLAQRVLHRLRKGAPGSRERAQRAGEDAIELQHWTLVENHRVQFLRLKAAVPQTALDRQ